MPDPFYRSPEWRAARAKVLRGSGWRCAWCGADCRGPGGARVDHVRSRKAAPELALHLPNLRVLCPACDNRRHVEKGGRAQQRYSAEGLPLDPAHHWNRPR